MSDSFIELSNKLLNDCSIKYTIGVVRSGYYLTISRLATSILTAMPLGSVVGTPVPPTLPVLLESLG